MKALNISYYGQSRYWWVMMLIGILLVIGGFAYWFWPAAGYAVASMIFGWLLILAGIVQLCVSSGNNRPRGWGWWLAGGVINMFIGFVLVRNIFLAEMVFPYFLAFLFVFWGIESLVSASSGRRHYWWLAIINGILLCLIGFFFMEAGYYSNMYMISFLTAIAFIYWGFTVAMAAVEMKPVAEEAER